MVLPELDGIAIHPNIDEPFNGEEIKLLFLQIKDAKTLAYVLNAAAIFEDPDLANKKIAHKRLVKAVSQRTINYYAYHKENRYKEFQIPKRDGSSRILKAPDPGLKKIQRLINICLSTVFTPRAAAHGFIVGRSIISNAKPHVGKRFVYNIDLKDFFPNTHFGRVHAILRLQPFNFTDEVAYLLANLCTDKGSLPQGAPTSPTLTNLVCQRLDRRLVRLAKDNKCTVTRYADDITFSSNKDIFTQAFKTEILSIIFNEGYAVNSKKERLQTHKERQEVTGVIVNKKLNVTREYFRQVRAMLHHWAAKGIEEASSIHRELYERDKGALRNKGRVPAFINVLAGKIQYLGMVRGREDKLFLQYLHRFNTLNAGINHDELDLDIQLLKDLRTLAQKD